jgi:hypothetical protein
MKYVKMLGLAAMAAMALMAVGGAGTASAAELCTENKAPCPTEKKHGAGTTIEASVVGTATLTTNTTNVHCSVSDVHGTTTTAGGSGKAVLGEIESLSFEQCETSGGTECEVTTQGFPASASLVATGGGNGTMTVTGEPGAHVQCGFFINCTFTTKSIALDVTGGNPAHVTASEEELLRSGGFCPTVSKWDATYKVNAPKPLFVV